MNKNNSEMNSKLPCVSIIVIGHNESNNLESCFKAIDTMNYPREKLEVIYVDSNSTDNSVSIALTHADKVFCEKSQWSTAGEALNRGIVESSYDIIHNTGGDIQLDKDYLLNAVKKLQQRSDIEAVTGYFKEKNDFGWNRIIGYRREEDNPIEDHFVMTPNGGTFRKQALVTIKGYDERIKKGQEAELGVRFNKAGFKILHVNMVQGVHDFELNTTKDILKRYFWNSFYTTHLLFLYLADKKNNFLKIHSKKKLKQLFIHSLLLLLIGLAITTGVFLFAILFLVLYFSFFYISVLKNSKKFTANYKKYRFFTFLMSSIGYWGSIYFILKIGILKIKGVDLILAFKGLNIEPKESLK